MTTNQRDNIKPVSRSRGAGTVSKLRSSKFPKEQIYPACVGLSRIGSYPNTIYTLWNDLKGSRPLPWYYKFIPMKFLTWNNKGVLVRLCIR